MTSLHLGPQDTLDVALKKTWVCGESLERGRRQIKVEQVALSARLTIEDKVTLSCVKFMTSFRKTREVLLD